MTRSVARCQPAAINAPPTFSVGWTLSVTVTRVPKTLTVAIGVFSIARGQPESSSHETAYEILAALML